MRKSIILLVVLALLAGFGLMSCKNEVATQDTLSEVCISLSKERGVTGTVTSSIPDVSDLYWFYVATKADKRLYATGATPWKAVQEEKGLTEGTPLGLFSQGKWKFSFYGFMASDVPALEPGSVPSAAQLEKAVYYAEGIEVVVNNATATVDIALTVGTIMDGKVVLSDLTFDLTHVASEVQFNADAEGSFVLHVKYSDNEGNHDIASKPVDYVSGTKEYSFFLPVGVVDNETVYESTKTIADIADGTYTYTFEVVFTDTEDTPNSIVVATEDVGVTISKGTIVTFRGDVFYSDPVDEVVIGEVSGETKATASFTVSSGKALTVSANITPASVDSGSATTTTTVEFPKDSLKSTVLDEVTGNTTSYDHDLKVEVAVKNVTATSETFVIGTTETPVAQLPANTVAGIDLTLTQKTTVTDSNNDVVGTPVVEALHSFEDNAVVTVSTYIATGLLNVDVYYNGLNYFNNKGVNTPYLESYDAATGLLKFKTNHFSDFWVTGAEPVAKIGSVYYETLPAAIAAHSAGDTITLLKDVTLGANAVLRDVTLDLGGKTITSSYYLDCFGTTTIKNGTIDYNAEKRTKTAVWFNGDNTLPVLTIEDVVINTQTAAGEKAYCITGWESGASLVIKSGTFNGQIGTNGTQRNQAITINGGTFNAGVYFPAEGAYEITGGTFNSGVEIKSGTLTVSGGTFNNAGDPQTYTPYWNGTTLSGCSLGAVAYDGNDYGSSPVLTITGGTFAGKIGLARASKVFDYPSITNSTDAEVVLLGEFVIYVGDSKKVGRYDTLSEALEVAVDEDTIVLEKDIAINSSSEVTISKNITIVGGDYNVCADPTGGSRAIRLNSGKTLVVEGGNWKSIDGETGNNASIFDVQGTLIVNSGYFEGANTIIGITGNGEGYFNGGTYKSLDGGCAVIVVGSNAKAYVNGFNYICEPEDTEGPGAVWTKDGGTAYINGGTYQFNDMGEVSHVGEIEGMNYCLFDYREFVNYGYQRGYVYVYGGSFAGFNPASNGDSGISGNVNMLADGYRVEAEDNWYTVVAETNN